MATTTDLQKSTEKTVDAVVEAAVAAPKAVAALAEIAPLAAAAAMDSVAKATPKANRPAAKRPAAKRTPAKRTPAKRTPAVKHTPARQSTVAAKRGRKPAAVTAKYAPKTTAAKTAPKAKGKTMTDTVKTMTAQSEKIVAELKTRTGDAVAKSKAMFADANDFNKGNIEALVESSKIAAKGFEKLGQEQADYARKSFEQTTAAFKSMAGVKSPTELMKLHSDYVRSSFDAMVAQTSHSTEAFLKLAGAVAQPLSNRFAVAAEKVKLAA